MNVKNVSDRTTKFFRVFFCAYYYRTKNSCFQILHKIGKYWWSFCDNSTERRTKKGFTLGHISTRPRVTRDIYHAVSCHRWWRHFRFVFVLNAVHILASFIVVMLIRQNRRTGGILSELAIRSVILPFHNTAKLMWIWYAQPILVSYPYWYSLVYTCT